MKPAEASSRALSRWISVKAVSRNIGEERDFARNTGLPGAWHRDARRWRCRFDQDRKSTRLNSSHLGISYAVFCLKKKTDRKSNSLRSHHLGISYVAFCLQQNL